MHERGSCASIRGNLNFFKEEVVNRTSAKASLVLATGLCLALSQAHATNLLPGGTVLNPGSLSSTLFPTAPSTAVSSTGANNLLEEGSSWKVGTKTGAAITFVNGVWVDPVTGDLDFFYQIQNTFTGAAANNDEVLQSFTLGDYAGVGITGVFKVTFDMAGNGCAFFGPGPCPPLSNGSGFLRPTNGSINSVARSIDGADLTVTFNNSVNPGKNSAILVIQTDAKDFDQTGTGTFFWKGAPPVGSTGSGPGQNTKGPWVLDALEPILTPEPGFYGVLALGIAGLLLFVRRRSGKAQATKSEAQA
jgi:hypothetical protein